MSSRDGTQGQKHDGLSGAALAVVIAIPIIVGVALLLAIPFIIARFKQRRARKADSERGFRDIGHLHHRTMSSMSDTDKPLLLVETPPRSSFTRLRSPSPTQRSAMYGFVDKPETPRSHRQLPSMTLNSEPFKYDAGDSSHEKLADLATMAMPSLSPPATANKFNQPHLLSMPQPPKRPVSKPVDGATDPLRRPPSLTKPWAAPEVPGLLRPGSSRNPTRRGRPDMRGALLTRMATKRSRSQGDLMEDISPVSVYSQASLARGDTRKWFPVPAIDTDPSSAPPLPQPPADSSAHPELTRSHSFSAMPSPSRHLFQMSPTEGPEGELRFPMFSPPQQGFNDDAALTSPMASMVSNSRWWSNVWGSYIPSFPTNASPTQAASGGLGFPIGRRSLGSRVSANPQTRDAHWFHAMPEYGAVEGHVGHVDGERGQVMVAAWSLGEGNGVQGRTEREARRLPPTPFQVDPESISSPARSSVIGMAR